MITEPVVTFTDYGLTLECALFTYLLHRAEVRLRPLRNWFAVFFGTLGLAALAGGTVHGFFPDVNSTGFAILWPISLIAIGVAALSAWGIGAVLQFSEPVARLIILVASVVFTGYCAMVLFVTQNFLIAIVHYLPAAIFLLFVLSTQYVQSREWGILIGVIGLALIFIASFIQQLGISLHPVYFNHNALYHFIMAVALFMIFRTARWFVVARSTQMR